MPRLPLLFALLILSPCAHADDNEFSGAWVAWLCPTGAARDSGKCANFVLELHQQGDLLCGAHFFATAGAENLDEGAAPSLVGDIVDSTASATVVSTRTTSPVRIRVEVKKANGTLRWRQLDKPGGDQLLPLSATFSKSNKRTLFTPLFEQELSAACSSVFAMKAEGSNQEQPR